MKKISLVLLFVAALGAGAFAGGMTIPTISPGTLVTAAMWNALVSALNTLTAQAPASEFNAGNSGTAITVNFSTNGPLQKVTRNGNTTVTLTAPAAPGSLVIKFVHDGTGTTYTVAFSPSVKWPNGTAPTWTNSAGAIDVLTFYYDGTTFYGVQTPNLS